MSVPPFDPVGFAAGLLAGTAAFFLTRAILRAFDALLDYAERHRR